MSRDSEIVEIGPRIAEVSGDGADWTVTQALGECLDDLKRESVEPDGMLLILTKAKEDGSVVVMHYTARVNVPEAVWLAKIVGDRLTHGA